MSRLVIALDDGLRIPVDGRKLAAVHDAVELATTDDQAEALLEDLAREIVEQDPKSVVEKRSSLKGILDIIRPVDREIFLQRMRMCAVCEHAKPLVGELTSTGATILQCGKCGCVMNVKARLGFMHCPIGLF